MSLTVGSLFSGIGGLDLGLERAGMKVRWMCEIDPYCRKVLSKHWPDVICYEDVTTLDFSKVEPVDLICGGFPCQDLSHAGKRAGLSGERSGLFYEIIRAVCALRPRYVLLENVPGLLTLGMGDVLGELAAVGYDAEWQVLSAAQFGAPHLRERAFILGYPQRCGCASKGVESAGAVLGRGSEIFTSSGLQQDVADPDGERCRNSPQRQAAVSIFSGKCSPDTNWATEPDVGRVADGVPSRVDRLRCLGNAVVPQVAEWIGRQIIEYETLCSVADMG